jgi:hypothetical protein
MASIFMYGPYNYTGQSYWIPAGQERDISFGSWPWQGKVPMVSVYGWEATDTLSIITLTSSCNSPPSDRYVTARVRNTGRYTVYGYSAWIGGIDVN